MKALFIAKTLKCHLLKNIENFFALGQKFIDEGNDVLQGLFKLIMNSLYGVQIRKHIIDFHKRKSDHWMQTKYDDSVLDNCKLANGN